MSFEIKQGDALEVLKTLPSESVHCCVTSPPYWGLRDYGVSGQLGLEKTPELYVSRMTEVFREVRRVLRSDGTLWLNIGDSYCSGSRGGYDRSRVGVGKNLGGTGSDFTSAPNRMPLPGLKDKDLCGIPWLLAFALRSDGWYLRQDIIWSKPNPMPESVTDRCTKAHEYLFLLSKSARYHYDQGAILEPVAFTSLSRLDQDVDMQLGSDRVPGKSNGNMKAVARTPASYKGSVPGRNGGPGQERRSTKDRGRDEAGLRPGSRFGREAGWRKNTEQPLQRNKRSVWEVTTQPYSEAHFATFPPKLIEPCILAGCPEGGTVLDPFCGAGTTGLVATRLQRNALLIELNPTYCEMMRNRIVQDAPLFHAGAYALESGHAESGQGPIVLTDGQEKV